MSVPKMQLADWLDDLSVRFIINLPQEELNSAERICFQVEEAQWFYEDFIRPTDPHLPSMNLKQFCLAIFNHCPLFAGFDPEVYHEAFKQFLEYKTRVPVRGAILLNDVMDEVLLVRGWKKGSNWSFPRGKINKAEDDLDCAIREVFEETGLNVRAAGLIPKDNKVESITVTMREQSIKLYVIPNVPKETNFQPQTRKEIGGIQWYKLAELPTMKQQKYQQNNEGLGQSLATNANKFYMVTPFVGHLKKIIGQLKKAAASRPAPGIYNEQYADPGSVTSIPVPADTGMHATLAHNTSSDMERLLLQLKQSKEAQREQNLPEVSQPTELGPDGLPIHSVPASSRLESAPQYSIPPVGLAHSGVPVQAPFQGYQPHGMNMWPGQQSAASDFNAYPVPPEVHRAGLYPQAGFEPTPTSHYPSQGARPFHENFPPMASANTAYYPGQNIPAPQIHGQAWPQTPAAQLGQQPQMPPSPTHQHRPHVAHTANINAPPPTFAFAPAQIQQEQQHVPSPITLPGTAQQWLTSGRANAPARSRSPAPFQTGDNEFSTRGQNEGAAPEPNKLPLPKLTANSAKLLSLFTGKNPSPVEASPAAEMSADPRSRLELMATAQSSNPLTALLMNQNRPSLTVASMPTAADQPVTPALASPTELGSGSPTTNRPKTSQQSALLDLFKSQSSRSYGSPSPALAPGLSSNLPPAELSATQSPAQSFSQYERRTGSSEALAPPTYGAVTIQKRHAGNPSISTALTATVTGPLNVSEQEINKKSAGKGHKANASMTKPALTPGSVKILSRPGTSNGQAKTLESPKQAASPKPGRSPRRSRNDRSVHASPKPMQPQILKRPVEHSADNTAKELHIAPQPVAPTPMTILRRGAESTSPTSTPVVPARSTPTVDRGIVEAPSPMSRQTSTTEENAPTSAMTPAQQATPPFSFDRRSSQTTEQKASLLSLFGQKSNVSSTPMPPLSVTSSPLPSLLGAKITSPATGIIPAVSPMSTIPPRNRMGSMVSIGSADSVTGRSTPQTTNEKDKKFLLGFLNNVVDGNT